MASGLIKIEFDNMANFLARLNENFSTIENSPLFKGLPGLQGLPGDSIVGPRGTIYIFTKFSNFVVQFPELTNSNPNILTGEYINTLLADPSKRDKLLLALDVEFLNDTDIVVFESSTEMWQYHAIIDEFINTGVSFSSNINITNYVQNELSAYLNNIMRSLETQLSSVVLVNYNSISRNTALVNGIEDHNFQVGSSQYFPILNGVIDAGVGTLMSEGQDPSVAHRYFSFNDIVSEDENNISINTTFIIGSVRRFISLQEASMAARNGVYSTDYAPNSTNLPSVVLLQNNGLSGLLLGRKDESSLQSFASIYREAGQYGSLVFKSNYEPDSSNPTVVNNGILKMSSVELLWNKRLKVLGDHVIGGDLSLSDDFSGATPKVSLINSYFIKTIKNISNQTWDIILGTDVSRNSVATGGLTLKANTIKLTSDNSGNTNTNKFKDIILSTDNTGVLRTVIRIASELDTVSNPKDIYDILRPKPSVSSLLTQFYGSGRSNNLVTSETLYNLLTAIWGTTGTGDNLTLNWNSNKNLNNVWLKNQFFDFTSVGGIRPLHNIPSLSLHQQFWVGYRDNDSAYRSIIRTIVSSTSTGYSILDLGEGNTDITLNWNTLTIQKAGYQNKVLTTNSTSKLSSDFSWFNLTYQYNLSTNSFNLSYDSESKLNTDIEAINIDTVFSELSQNVRVGGNTRPPTMSEVGLLDRGVSKILDRSLGEIPSMIPARYDRGSIISKLFLTGINLRLIGGIFDKLIYWLKPQLTNILSLLNTKSDKSYLQTLNIVPAGMMLDYSTTQSRLTQGSINKPFVLDIPKGWVICGGGIVKIYFSNGSYETISVPLIYKRNYSIGTEYLLISQYGFNNSTLVSNEFKPFKFIETHALIYYDNGYWSTDAKFLDVVKIFKLPSVKEVKGWASNNALIYSIYYYDETLLNAWASTPANQVPLPESGRKTWAYERIPANATATDTTGTYSAVELFKITTSGSNFKKMLTNKLDNIPVGEIHPDNN